MNRKSKIILCITGITIILLSLIGLTFGFYLTKITPNLTEKSLQITTGDSSILFTDLTEEITEIIKPGYQTTKVFKVENTGTVKAAYSIFLVDVFNDFSRTADVVYTLYRKNGENSIDESNYTSGEIVIDSKGNKLENIEFPTTNALVIDNEILENPGDIYTYVMLITYADLPTINQNEDQGHTFSGKIYISGVDLYNPYGYDKNLLSYNIINNSILGRGGTIYSPEPLTLVAEEASGANEKVLSLTRDDYGTSYYYRGNVIDNYVNFAGMCWRIVRIEGDGTVKLLLEDRYTTCNDKEGQDLNNDGKYFTGKWNDGIAYAFGYDTTTYRADFINYEGGLVDSFKTFQTTLAKKINTTLTEASTKEELNTTLASKLKIDEWCYDDKVTATSGSTEYYGAYIRIETNKKPSLRCSGTKLNKYKDNTDMYVGTLTADEMSFAGAYNSLNDNYYLMNTYTKTNRMYYWWSLSPYFFHKGDGVDRAFLLSTEGTLHRHYVNGSFYSRPSVTLNSSTIATTNPDTETYGQPGTINNPYVIG